MSRRRRGSLPAISRAASVSLLMAALQASCNRGAEGTAAAGTSRDSTPGPRADLGQRRDVTVLAVMRDLSRDSSLSPQPVAVRARERTLILKGSVRDEDSHARLLEIARRHLGTFDLVDSLQIGAPPVADSSSRTGVAEPADRPPGGQR